MSNKLIAAYSSIERLRAALAKAVEAQAAAEALAKEAGEQFSALVAKSGFSTLQAKQFTTFGGDSIEAQITRSNAEKQFADHSVARARKERQEAERRLADAVASCRTLADEVAMQRVAEIRVELRADKSLRSRLLEACSVAMLPMASELGSNGWIRADEFVAELFEGFIAPDELNVAATGAVRRYLLGEL